MTRFFAKNDKTPAPSAPPSGADTALYEATQRLGDAAVDLIRAAKAARAEENEGFRRWGTEEIGPWHRSFSAARAELLDWCRLNRPALDQAARLIRDGDFRLVDLTVVRGFRQRYEDADRLRRAAPKDPPNHIEGILPRLRFPAEAEALIEQLIGPALNHATLSDEATSRWRHDVIGELPEAVFVTTGPSARGLIHDHTVLAERLELEPAEVPA